MSMLQLRIKTFKKIHSRVLKTVWIFDFRDDLNLASVLSCNYCSLGYYCRKCYLKKVLNFRRVLLKMDTDFELWILIPTLFHSSKVEETNKFSKKLCFILNEEYCKNFLSGMAELIWTNSQEICWKSY